MEGQPDQKRPRMGPASGSWSNASQHSRELPPPPQQATYHQQQQQPPPHASPFSRPDQGHIQDDRRRSAISDYPQEQDHRRPSTGPPAWNHTPPIAQYDTSRDTIMKRDPSDEPPQHYRPSSTGNIQDPNVPPPPTQQQQQQQQQHHQQQQHQSQQHPDDRRRFPLPGGFEGSIPVSSAYQNPPQYPPPQQLPQSPMGTPGTPFEGGMFPPSRDPYNSVTYPTTTAANTAKRKAQRASQACDSCRALKAKCDESKPCSSCKEKGTDCNYRDPPPKQYVPCHPFPNIIPLTTTDKTRPRQIC